MIKVALIRKKVARKGLGPSSLTQRESKLQKARTEQGEANREHVVA